MVDLFGGSPEPNSLSDSDVQFLDTTLRDGEQAPGISLTPTDKAGIAEKLDAAGVSVIEAGSACTGAGERETISSVTDLDLDATVTSFARGVKHDIELALDCGVDGVNLVVPASDRHIERKVGTTHDEVIQTTVSLVEYAKEHGLWLEVLGEDGSRADIDFLEQLMDAALDAGADRICYCDTVGHATPDHTADVVSRLASLGPTSTHTHDDLGLALTNALVSIAAGADLVHATVNGIGERAGNVAIEEVAVALDHGYDVETVATERLYDLAQAVATATDVPLAPNKAVVGENAFTHESGIHTDGTLKDDGMYEPYPPTAVGRERRLVLGKHAGRAGVRAALDEHNVAVTEDELRAIVDQVKEIGERGRRITDTDLLAIADEVQGRERDQRVELLDLTATSGGATPTASVRLAVDGEDHVASGVGSGPVDAAITATRKALDIDATLESYHVDAITGGTDALVTVEVEVSHDDHSVTVHASDADITRASVTAMLDAFNRLLETDPRPATGDD